MSRPQNPRVIKVFSAMKALDIEPATFKPVLKRLLKLYDHKWELIEEDNYRTLLDAIFESEDEKKNDEVKVAVEHYPPEPSLKNHQENELLVEHDAPEPPLKKHHGLVAEDEASSTMGDGHMHECQSYVEFSAKPASNLPSSGHLGDHLNPVRQHSNESLRSEHMEQNVMKKRASGSGSSTCFTASHPQPASLSLFISDISKETETVSISLVDEISGEKEPLPSFVYIRSNIVYQAAYVHVSLAGIADKDCCSGCKMDCLSSVSPCACARETGGQFAYTPEGLVKEEFLRKCILMNEKPQQHHLYYCQECPLERANKNRMPKNCKGHLMRRFIKECWRKCGCNMSCGNRVVQRGISRKLQVFLKSEGKGWGVRTLEVLPKGAFVCEYIGEILTNMELFERINQNNEDRHTYHALLDGDWGSKTVPKAENALCLDANHFGNVARFINHRCHDANLIEIPVEVESPSHHYYHLALFTKRKVDALEELTWDYHIQNHLVKAFQCYCGSALCRDQKGKGSSQDFSYINDAPIPLKWLPPKRGKERRVFEPMSEVYRAMLDRKGCFAFLKLNHQFPARPSIQKSDERITKVKHFDSVTLNSWRKSPSFVKSHPIVHFSGLESSI